MLPHYERKEKALDGFKKALESSQRALRSSQHAILDIHVQALVQDTLVRDVLNSRLIMREASALDTTTCSPCHSRSHFRSEHSCPKCAQLHIQHT